MQWVLIPRNVIYIYHEELEGITIVTYFMCFIEMMSKTELCKEPGKDGLPALLVYGSIFCVAPRVT